MKIIKSNGSQQDFNPNKILTRIKKASKGLKVDHDSIFKTVISDIKEGMTTKEIDECIAFSCAYKIIDHPDYSKLGGRVLVSTWAKHLNQELQPIDEEYNFFSAYTFFEKYAKKDENGNPMEIPSKMYERVANYLSDTEEDKKELFEELTNKRVNFATPTYTNADVDGRGAMISCFVPNTKVWTKDGVKPICEVKVGDEVLTHNNRYKKVLNVFENPLYNRLGKNLKVYRTAEIKCTDNHKFLSYTSEDERLGLEPSFKPIKWLRVGDYIKMNTNNNLEETNEKCKIIDVKDYEEYLRENWVKFKEVKNNHTRLEFEYTSDDKVKITSYYNSKGIETKKHQKVFNRYLKVDEVFCKFLGLYLGDGNLIKSKKSGILGINITSKAVKGEIYSFMKEAVPHIFGIDFNLYKSNKDEREWFKLSIHSKAIGLIFENMFGSYFNGKFIPEDFKRLPKSLLRNIIAGIISSDGIVTKEGNLRVQLANNRLTDDIFYISRILGYPVGVSKVTPKNNNAILPQYRLDFGRVAELFNIVSKDYGDDRMYLSYKLERNKLFTKEVNGEKYLKIMDIQPCDLDSVVYDLEVEDDHSYTVEGIAAHNCNLTELYHDSLEGIEETKKNIAKASKEGSGIGLLIDSLRSKHSLVSSFKGFAGGVVRFADMIQSTMRFYKQGSRSGSCALYMSLWHRDIFDFLSLRLPIGEEKERARDLFLAVVVNDLFMEKLISNDDWYLFCPNEIKKAGLKPFHEIWGKEFEEEYSKAVDLGIGYKTTARKVLEAIVKSQVESGNPYVFFKDNANRVNMQDNIGIIKFSNLCAEICSVSKPGYTSQCTLASINLAAHDNIDTIEKSTKVLVKALNVVIDKNKWSDEWSEKAGIDQRSLAIGVAGLADFFAKKKISFESEEAKEWTDKIFSTMYKSAVEESNRLAEERGVCYPAWKGSKYEKGETYIKGWSPKKEGEPIPMLNSLLIGLMPTASSAILLGSFESFEPVTSNFFTRKVGQGEFLVVNEYLVRELESEGLWNESIKDKIVANRGSIQTIMDIPQDIRYRYKDVWEIPQRTLLDLSAIRNKYVDQSQSLNVYHAGADFNKIVSAMVYAWKVGLKTGVYYTRTKSKLQGNSDMATSSVVVEEKPKNSVFECDGCST